MLIERRIYPRFEVRLPVRMTIATSLGEIEYQAETVTLSQNGLQVNCSREIAEALAAQEEFPPSCRLCLELPSGQPSIDSRCRLIVSRRITHDGYHLGFSFLAIQEQSEQALAAYLAACFAETAPR